MGGAGVNNPLLLPARPPRRKRIIAGSTNASSGDGGMMNGGGGSSSSRRGLTLVQHDDTDPSVSPSSSCGTNRSSSAGRSNSRRIRNGGYQRRKGRRKNSHQWLGMHIVPAAAFFIIAIIACYVMLLWNNDYNMQQLSTNTNNEDAGNELQNSNAGMERILNELSKVDSPLTEEIEQEILSASHDNINQFPISIGTDIDGNNPNWETIVHPAAEALRYFNKGDRYAHQQRTPIKSRMTPSDLARVLSRNQQQLRGGRSTVGGKDTTNVLGDADQEEVDEGLMRVPKFWDPSPYRIIADERARRQRSGSDGGSRKNNSTDHNTLEQEESSGVRRYLGNYGARLMTPAEAKSIGSRIPLNNDNNTTSNADEALLLETIFVAVASYRDWQCSRTVESAFKRATYPERIRVAVVDQIRIGLDSPCSVPPNGTCDIQPDQAACKYKSQIDYFTVDAELSVGPVFARHLGNRLYRGEYFAVQSDAHVEFTNGWDTEIIEQWHSAKNEMAILSTYLSGVEDHIDLETGNRTSLSRPIMCQSDFEGSGVNKHLRHGQQPEGIPYIHDMPTLHPFWAAGFSFGRGHFVVNVPYDQHLPGIFQGEEISIGLRGFSYGYDYYTPERAVCFHFYGRKNVPLFWENHNRYSGSGEYGMKRLNAIIHLDSPDPTVQNVDWIRIDESKYGIGKVRDLQVFFDVFGIHVKEQRVEANLCRFVGRPMQKEFIPSLRSNEMGLDYERISFRFVDEWKNEQS